ncbi:MAG: hypothetical protein KAS39_05045 [Actinomycetia bacterium]|nr:hypothetical protein [Actinomycetes bacterium]
MKIYFITSGGEKRSKDDKEWCVLFDDIYARRVIRHLNDDSTLCTGCGDKCINCRKVYKLNYSQDIVGELKLPRAILYYVDKPRDYLPKSLPKHDVTIAINIHEDILLALPEHSKKAGAKAIIAPVEDPEWVSRWTREELLKRCANLGMEAAVPKPSCALEEKNKHPFINEFMNYYRIGRPKLKIEVEKGKIKKVKVLRSAPCGDTYYVAHNLRGKPVDETIEKHVAKYWHAYPCVGSMKMDYELGDTILHVGGYIHYDAFNEALELPLKSHPQPYSG